MSCFGKGIYLCLIDTLNIRSREICIDLIEVFLVHVLRNCILVQVIHHTGTWKYAVHLPFKWVKVRLVPN